jgi:sugar phosphate isomerase/epimerase
MLLATSLNVFHVGGSLVPYERAMERCVEAGFDAIDFSFTDYWRPMMHERIRGQFRMDDLTGPARSKAEALGVPLVQTHASGLQRLDQPPQTPATTFAFFEETLRWAGELGIPWVVFHAGTIAGPWDAQHMAELRQRNIDAFGTLLKTAEPLGVGIAIENFGDSMAHPSLRSERSYCATPAELVDLVDAINSPLVGICWDSGHAHVQRLDQYQALLAVGHRLKATHIQDNDGVVDQHYLPYQPHHLGPLGIDWDGVMRALREINYQEAFCYEVHSAFNGVPDVLRNDLLRYAAKLGRHLMAL